MAQKNSNTKITFEYEGQKYTLEFTADSLKKMEQQGFKFGKIDEQILTAPEELFFGAFIEHHATTTRKKRRAIYEALCAESEEDEVSLQDVIFEMLTDALNEFTKKKSGNVTWRKI